MSQPPPNVAAFDPAGRNEPRTDLDYSLGSCGDRDTIAALAHTVYGGAISQRHARLERGDLRDSKGTLSPVTFAREALERYLAS